MEHKAFLSLKFESYEIIYTYCCSSPGGAISKLFDREEHFAVEMVAFL